MTSVADIHWRLLRAVPSVWLSRFVVRGTLPGPFPADLIERIRDRMNGGRFLSSTCLPIDESQWRQKRCAHPGAALFRASAERAESEVCVHAVDADFGTLKVVWIGMSNDASIALYEVFFPSLAAFVLIALVLATIAMLALVLVTSVPYWLHLWALVLLAIGVVDAHVTSKTRKEIVRTIGSA